MPPNPPQRRNLHADFRTAFAGVAARDIHRNPVSTKSAQADVHTGATGREEQRIPGRHLAQRLVDILGGHIGLPAATPLLQGDPIQGILASALGRPGVARAAVVEEKLDLQSLGELPAHVHVEEVAPPFGLLGKAGDDGGGPHVPHLLLLREPPQEPPPVAVEELDLGERVRQAPGAVAALQRVDAELLREEMRGRLDDGPTRRAARCHRGPDPEVVVGRGGAEPHAGGSEQPPEGARRAVRAHVPGLTVALDRHDAVHLALEEQAEQDAAEEVSGAEAVQDRDVGGVCRREEEEAVGSGPDEGQGHPDEHRHR
mmetsp:Transcript_6510/g.20801  ORF Transcript_6510/g.20801 Transcript_6510/m.20801 type:complete len:314 (-) Transcript_6510:555-1496(-)